MKQGRWILVAPAVCLAVALGVAYSWRRPAPVRRESPVGASSGRTLEGPAAEPISAPSPVLVPMHADAGGGQAAPAPSPEDPSSHAATRTTDPTGEGVRAWVREAVTARRQRDWAALRALAQRLSTASRRDVNILLHLLQRESDTEAMLAIGELATESARSPGSELDRGTIGPALGRAARKVLDRAEASVEQRSRAVALLAGWAASEDVPGLLGLLSGHDVPPGLGSAAAIALAQSGDPVLWLAPLRREADAVADVRTLARIAVALDGVGRRGDDASVVAWLDGTLVPRVQRWLGSVAGADCTPDGIGEVVGALALIARVSQVDAALAAIAVQSEVAARARLVAWLPEAASPEEWADARAVLMRDPGLGEAVAEVDARMSERGRAGE